MQRPLQIAFRDMESSPALEGAIRARVDALERRYPRITGCRVVVEVPHRGSESAKVPIAVSVEIDIPGRNTLVAREQQERHEAKDDQFVALNRAFEAIERQLEKVAAAREDGPVPVEATGESGMIVRLFPEQSYGFVQVDNSPELYFTRNAVAGDAFDELRAGMLVHVTRASDEGPMGPQASSVRLLDRLRSAAEGEAGGE